MFLRTLIAILLLTTTLNAAGEFKLTPEQQKQYADLETALTGSALVGNFTVTGKTTSEPKAERYELLTVEHVGDGNWLFIARIQYGDHDVKLPITLPIKWAGDTPVITVDKMSFPGLGTYTARVMIYDGHYAGFWSGADHGGHLFGVVERGEAKADQGKAQ
jgi:hypothetical protein